MCPCIKFQSIWRTLDFSQICQKLNELQSFEKLNIKGTVMQIEKALVNDRLRVS